MTGQEGGRAAPKPRAGSRSRRTEVEGFGCPRTEWPHHVRVVIPEIRGGEVHIVEDFGVGGHSAGQGDETERCVLPRARWNAIADLARREFNERLRSLGLPPGAWKPGATKVERMLGQELILLACATAAADEADVAAVGASWASLRPEERWWFAGWLQSRPSERVMRGAALLLSGGPAEPRAPRPAAPKQQVALPLFDTPSGKH
ncbi:DUF3780 domain-containing protein [Muricoccus radiodurans]|uniref:DUF3780 domain-containing protein n=1 Tax=Muricoccus radiodurans TaxID=2231721 RepID=UPI003CF25DD5